MEFGLDRVGVLYVFNVCGTSRNRLSVTILATIDVISSKMDVKCRDLNPGDKVYFCPQILTPVCGSNMRTYDNHCDYCAERWEKQQNGENWDVVLDHEGRCDSPGVSTIPTLSDIIKNPRVPTGQNSPFPKVDPNPIYQISPVDQSFSPFSQHIQQSQNGYNFFKNVLERYFPKRNNGNHFGQFNNRGNTGQFVPSWKANLQNSWQTNRDQNSGRYDWQNYRQNSGFGNGYQGSPFDRFSSQSGSSQTTSSQFWRRTNCQYSSGCARNGMVCGSDNRSYYNECHLCSSTSQAGREVKFVKPGRC
ncbi:hypothetical protein LOTGIDRAFT_169694 [Lottia gigantea]|uniref:Kazal-like domain-containing protein n=1 Tax=Lottia gigantea TaxID=225164 RepID=V3YY57_LOTGI|nr:hypothetical protein LOTGIDRAFT_169694 [Lottia gigantea]ESO83058.1 hypothetical protein LOTGIDRAFT_169694 [Lottia gigantea]